MATVWSVTTTEIRHAVVDRFLAGIEVGHVPADLYASGARLDATVPGWRFQLAGPDAIALEYARWFAGPSTFAFVVRHALPDGELVRYVQDFTVDGQPHTAHHVHLLRVEGDHIVADTVFCGGRWGPELLAEIGAAAHAG